MSALPLAHSTTRTQNSVTPSNQTLKQALKPQAKNHTVGWGGGQKAVHKKRHPPAFLTRCTSPMVASRDSPNKTSPLPAYIHCPTSCLACCITLPEGKRGQPFPRPNSQGAVAVRHRQAGPTAIAASAVRLYCCYCTAAACVAVPSSYLAGLAAARPV